MSPSPLGAPGIYSAADTAPPALRPIRMDVAAFVGVAPRGPCREPVLPETWAFDAPTVGLAFSARRRSVAVAVESFEDYRRLFGGFEGPGRLPYAVATFFEQGGRKAYVVRIVPDYGPALDGSGTPLNDADVARGVVPLITAEPDRPVVLHARSEGAWGNRLRAGIGLSVRPFVVFIAPPLAPTVITLFVDPAILLPEGSLLRLTLADGRTDDAFVANVARIPRPASGRWVHQLTLDRALAGPPVQAVVIEASSVRPLVFLGFGAVRSLVFLGSDATPPAPGVTALFVDPTSLLPEGSLLRLTLADGRTEDASVANVERISPANHRWVHQVTLDRALAGPPVQADVIEASLLIDDGAGHRETFEAVGMHPTHPRWLATVLCNESTLVWPDARWVRRPLRPETSRHLPRPPLLPAADDPPQFDGGQDRYDAIVPEDFFDDSWVEGNPDPGSGVHALLHLADLSTVVVPDLYLPEPLAPLETITEVGPTGSASFAPCIDPPPPIQAVPANPQLPGLLLDPTNAQARRRIIALQLRLEEMAERRRTFVVLLDVPPRLTHRQLRQWRAEFHSSYVAAYHPWLLVARPDDARDALIRVNPSAVAAGAIALREQQAGVPTGPANLLANGIVDVDVPVSRADHDELHPLGINVFRTERDGVRLTAARTLSTDARFRQLSVRRLMLMLHRVLEQETHWMVFEPNGPALWADVRQMLVNYLRTLYRAGAFRGATEADAFFVRCDATLNPPSSLDTGRLLVEVGVAPSEPMEFILLRLLRSGDRTLVMEL